MEIPIDFLARLDVVNLLSIAALLWIFYSRIDKKFEKVDEKFAKIDEKFAKIDEKFAKIDEKFADLSKDVQQINTRLAILETKFSDLNFNAVYLMFGNKLNKNQEIADNSK